MPKQQSILYKNSYLFDFQFGYLSNILLLGICNKNTYSGEQSLGKKVKLFFICDIVKLAILQLCNGIFLKY